MADVETSFDRKLEAQNYDHSGPPPDKSTWHLAPDPPAAGAIKSVESFESDLAEVSSSSADSWGKASNVVTMMHILRSFVGAGILSMPYAFSHAGTALAPIGILAVAAVVVYSCFCLVSASQELSEIVDRDLVDYGETFQAALKVGPKWCREKVSRHGKWIINILICILQPGFVTPYIVFIAENFKEILHLKWAETETGSLRLVIMCVVPLLMILVMVRNIQLLGVISLSGNFIFLIGFIIIIQEVVQEPKPFSELPILEPVYRWPTFFSSCIFAFEGIIPLLHIKAQMRTPKSLYGGTGVLLSSFYIIFLLYFTMGFFGYMKYGAAIQDTVTKSLPDAILYKSLKILYSCVLLATFPIQLLPVVEILYGDWLVKYAPANHKLCFERIFRLLLACGTAVIPFCMPSVGILIEVFGATLGTTFAIVLPNVIQLLVRFHTKKWGKFNFYLVLHSFILFVSALLIAVGTYTSIKNFREHFQESRTFPQAESFATNFSMNISSNIPTNISTNISTNTSMNRL